MYRCAGLAARSTALADVHSDELVTRAETTVASEVWVFLFQTGPAEVQLVVADVDRVPTAAFERSVLALLIHRAGQSLP